MKIISILLLFMSLISAKNHTDIYPNDASDSSKSMMRSIYMTICHATFGTRHGLYVKSYQGKENHKTCEELSPLFKHVVIAPYSSGKKKSGNAGSIGFGKSPHHCSLELTNTNGKVTGIPYGDKDTCSNIKGSGTIVLLKNEKQKPVKKDEPHVVTILEYGAPHGIGQTFSSKILCQQELIRLSKANAGLDYSYTCVKK